MTFFGGISFIAHFIIIMFKWVRRNPKPTMTIFSVSGIIIFGALFSLKQSINNSPNVKLIKNTFYGCQKTAQAAEMEDNVIILRLDDVQAFAWKDISMRMIDEMIKKNIPATIGVIPKNLEEDEEIANYLKKTSCDMEIAQHGWDHGRQSGNSKPEFEGVSKNTAYKRIIKGKEYLESIFDKEIVTFIPPNEVYSNGTVDALKQAEIPFLANTHTVALANYENNVSKLNSTDKIIDSCKQGFESDNLCVVMLHPQDYATNGYLDESKYSEFTELLNRLEELNAGFMTIKDYAGYKLSNTKNEND